MLRVVRRSFSTLNRGEMKQFDSISDWWHPAGPMHILYRYNYERVEFLRYNLNLQQNKLNSLKPLEGLSILDVGCGAGFMAKSLTRLGASVVGLDPNATSYRQAVEHKAKFGDQLASLTYKNCTLEEYLKDNEKKQFDVVASMDVIEHVDQPEQFLKELVSATRPGGTVMVSTIARNPVTWLTHILFAEYITGIVPKNTHSYQKFINPNDLQEMLLRQGVQVSAKRELQISWRGDFEKTPGGGNYILLGRKAE